MDYSSLLADLISSIPVLMWVVYTLCIALVVLIITANPKWNLLITIILAILWGWEGRSLLFLWGWGMFAGMLGCLGCVQGLNYGNLILSTIEGAVIVICGALESKLSFKFRWNVRGVIGILLMVYGFVGYPALRLRLDSPFWGIQEFGLVPWDLTVLTIGCLLMTDGKVSRWILLGLPLLSLSGSRDGYNLSIVVRIIIVVLGVTWILIRDRYHAGQETLKPGYT